MVRADVGQTTESASASRCTRSHSHAGPVWNVQDMLILVNEIAAVEGDCQDALSSYQKWTIVAQNCTALEVVSNATQCRRKWESLLAEFNLVKEWESNSGSNSYWTLESETRQKTGLPEEFDKDLYKAIDDFTKVTKQIDRVPEHDSEAEGTEVDMLDVEDFGRKPKRVKHWSPPRKRTKGRKRLVLKEEHEKREPVVKNMEQIMAPKLRDGMETGSKPKRPKYRSSNLKSVPEERKQPMLDEDHEKPVPVFENVEQTLATKVKENTELIHAILADNSDMIEGGLSSIRDETMKTERVRSKAEKLIACLTDLAKNLEQFCDVVKEC